MLHDRSVDGREIGRERRAMRTRGSGYVIRSKGSSNEGTKEGRKELSKGLDELKYAGLRKRERGRNRDEAGQVRLEEWSS